MRSLQSLVVVDADSRRREALAFGFRRVGLSVHATAEPRQSVVPGRAAGAVVIATPIAGATLAEVLAPLRRPPHPPAVLVIGGPGEREIAEGAGAEFLPRPAFFRDVLTVLKLAVAMRSEARRFEGQIEEYGLFYVARAIHHARRSATLEVEREGGSARQGRTGELRFSRGHLIGARAGRQHGANAFLQLLVWERGPLAVSFGEPPRDEKVIGKPTERLFEDALLFLAEFRSAVGRLGGPEAVYARDEARIRELGGLIPREVRQWIDQIDASRIVLDLVEDSPFKPFETLAMVHRLAELGAIVRRAVLQPLAPEERARRAAREWLLGFGKEQEGVRREAGLAAQPATAPTQAPAPVRAPEPSVPIELTQPRTQGNRTRRLPARPPPLPPDAVRRQLADVVDDAATRPFVRPTEAELGLPDVTPLPAPAPPPPPGWGRLTLRSEAPVPTLPVEPAPEAEAAAAPEVAAEAEAIAAPEAAPVVEAVAATEATAAPEATDPPDAAPDPVPAPSLEPAAVSETARSTASEPEPASVPAVAALPNAPVAVIPAIPALPSATIEGVPVPIRIEKTAPLAGAPPPVDDESAPIPRLAAAPHAEELDAAPPSAPPVEAAPERIDDDSSSLIELPPSDAPVAVAVEPPLPAPVEASSAIEGTLVAPPDGDAIPTTAEAAGSEPAPLPAVPDAPEMVLSPEDILALVPPLPPPLPPPTPGATAARPATSDGNPFVAPQSLTGRFRPETGRFLRDTGRFLRDSGRFPKFDSVDEDFFSREDEATRVEPVEQFDDLEPAPQPVTDDSSGEIGGGQTRTWFGLRPTKGSRRPKKKR